LKIATGVQVNAGMSIGEISPSTEISPWEGAGGAPAVWADRLGHARLRIKMSDAELKFIEPPILGRISSLAFGLGYHIIASRFGSSEDPGNTLQISYRNPILRWFGR
jgi:hypothetical protein